jgi:hypothetical protein
MAMAGGAAADGENFFDGGVREALEQNAFADHAGGTGEDDFQGRDAPWLSEVQLLVRLRRAPESYKILATVNFWPLAYRRLAFRPGVGLTDEARSRKTAAGNASLTGLHPDPRIRRRRDPRQK